MEEEKRRRELELFAVLQSDKGFTRSDINELFVLVVSDNDTLNGAARLVGCPGGHYLTKNQFNALLDKVIGSNNSKAAARFLLDAQDKLKNAQIKKLFAVAKNEPDEVARLLRHARRATIHDLLSSSLE